MDSFSTTKMSRLESNRNKPTQREKIILAIEEKIGKKKKAKREPVLNIYAELSRKDYRQILNGELEICVPYGVRMSNRAGSRGLFFECDDEDAVKILIDGLDASYVSWQEND